MTSETETPTIHGRPRSRVIVRAPEGVYVFEGGVPSEMRRRIDVALADGSAIASLRKPVTP